MIIYILIPAVTILIIFCFWRFYFFYRDPDRNIPSGRNIVSAADGTVVYVKQIKKGLLPISIKRGREVRLDDVAPSIDSIMPHDKYIVGVFMHPTSVHFNRAPVDGIIKFQRYFGNKINLPMTLMWWRVVFGIKPYEAYSDHILKNERNIIAIDGVVPVVVVQIADIYVNRIISNVKPGHKVIKGQKIGGIFLGSQVDIIFPCSSNLKILVHEGDKVTAGSSIIAEY